jgi:hypothetical protein
MESNLVLAVKIVHSEMMERITDRYKQIADGMWNEVIASCDGLGLKGIATKCPQLKEDFQEHMSLEFTLVQAASRCKGIVDREEIDDCHILLEQQVVREIFSEYLVTPDQARQVQVLSTQRVWSYHVLRKEMRYYIDVAAAYLDDAQRKDKLGIPRAEEAAHTAMRLMASVCPTASSSV